MSKTSPYYVDIAFAVPSGSDTDDTTTIVDSAKAGTGEPLRAEIRSSRID